MLPIVQVDIDPDAVVPCPEAGFRNRRATKCIDCEHFAGIGQMSTVGPWHKRFAIRCKGVVERRTQSLAEILGE